MSQNQAEGNLDTGLETDRESYHETARKLDRISDLCGIGAFASPVREAFEIFYPPEVLQGRQEMVSAKGKGILSFLSRFQSYLRCDLEALTIERSKRPERAVRWLAFHHALEREVLLGSPLEADLEETTERLLTFGIAWLLTERNVLSFFHHEPGTVVAPQGSTSSLVLFNFVPLDVFVNRNHVATVPPFSIVGESGIFGMPRSAELRIPRDEILGDLPSIATLNTQQLKDFMPRLYEIFRIEIFIAFLEKLHKSNARKWQILEALQEREDLQSRKPSKGPRRVGTDPLDTLWHSPLFSGVVSREILDRLWKIVQKIARVETFRKGEEILPAHAVPDRIFAVHKGAVRLVGPAGEHLDEIVAGEISGEEFIAGTPSQTAWVSDSDDLVICSIYKRDLLDSPVKTLFFRNCFRILQEKIKANDRFIIQNEKRLYGLSPERTPSRPTDPSPSKTSTTPSSQPREADRSAPPQPAPIPSPPVGTQFRDARLARSEGTESAFPTFRRFRDAISESLSHWLGRSVEEKQDRELHEILDQLEGKES